MKHIQFYRPKPADVLVWYKGRGILGFFSALLGSHKYYHTSMVVLDPETNIFYNYEQNADFVSEKPRPLGEVVSSSSNRFVVLRPNLPRITENLKFHVLFKDANPQRLLLCITKAMEKLVPLGYNELDVFRAYWDRYRKRGSIRNALVSDQGVEILYNYRLPRSNLEWTAVEARNSLTCSGAVASAFALCGIQLFPFLPWYALPRDFLKTTYLAVLGYIDYMSVLVNN